MSSPYLGLDIGFKRTGLAISESGLIAAPLKVVEANPPHMGKAVAEIVAEIRDNGIATVVVGLPFSEDGEPTPQSTRVEGVIRQLRQALAEAKLTPELLTVNEYASTEEAKAAFPGVELDAAAAAVILQNFLDQSRP